MYYQKGSIFEGRKLIFSLKYKECGTMQVPVTVMIENKSVSSGT